MTLILIHHVYDGRRETSREDYAAGWGMWEIRRAEDMEEVA